MLTTNPNLKIWFYASSFCYCNLHQTSYSVYIKGLEWVFNKNLFFKIFWKEFTFCIFPAKAKNCLRQIVCAKTKKLCSFGHLICSKTSSYNFKHSSKVYL